MQWASPPEQVHDPPTQDDGSQATHPIDELHWAHSVRRQVMSDPKDALLCCPMSELSSLTELDLAGIAFGPPQLASLVPFTGALRRLRRLFLQGGMNLDREVAAVLAPLLAGLPELRHLDLSGTGMDAASMVLLSPALGP